MRFWFRLAATLGMPVKRVMQEVDSDEFSCWVALNQTEPVGDGKLDLLAGMLASVNAGVTLGKKENGERFKAGDFMFRYWEDAPQVDREQVAAKVRLSLNRIARKFGGNS